MRERILLVRESCLAPARAFTLIEVLVVVGIIALLLAILLPSMTQAREVSRVAVCGSNIRQIAMANIGYAAEHRDAYVPAADDIWWDLGNMRAGRHRWHGGRDDANSDFDPRRGPLKRYLKDGAIQQCPSWRFDSGSMAGTNSFESGCGGYGYNHVYVGGRYDLHTSPQRYEITAKTTDVRQPTRTAMFADTAFAQPSDAPPLTFTLIPYSFLDPPLIQLDPMVAPEPTNWSSPSTHFRHRNKTSTAWVDGHVSTEAMSMTRYPVARYTPVLKSLGIGWFGPRSNDLFDLK